MGGNTATEIPAERVDTAVDDLTEVIDEAKAAEKAAKKAARKAKVRRFGTGIKNGTTAVGRAVIDTDLRDMGKGVKRLGKGIADHTPRVKVVRAESAED